MQIVLFFQLFVLILFVKINELPCRALTPSVEGFNPQSGQVNDWKIGTWCFPG